MEPAPYRDWRMVEILRAVPVGNYRTERARRKQVLRAIQALAECGVILIRPPSSARGGYATYRWK